MFVTAVSIIDQLAGFVFRIILSRSIGAEGMGIYQISLSLVFVFISIACSGIPFVLGKKVAEYKPQNDKKAVFASVTACLVIAIVVSAVLMLIFLLLKVAVDISLASPAKPSLIMAIANAVLLSSGSMRVTLYLIPSILAISVYSCMRGWLWGSKKFFTHSALKLIDQFLRIILGLIFLRFATVDGNINATKGAEMAALSYTFSAFTIMTISLVIYFSSKNKLVNPKKYFKSIIVSIIPVGGIRVAGNLYQSLIAVIFPLRLAFLTNASNSHAIAQYGILSGMTLPMIALPTIFVSAITTAVMPEISSNMKTQNFGRVRYILTKSYHYCLLFGGLAIGLYLVFGAKLGAMIFNNVEAGYFVQAGCWILLPLAVSSLTTSMLNSLGLEYKSLINYIISAVIILLFVWFTPSFLGSYSLVIGMGVGMSLAAILNTINIIKKVKLKASILKTTSFIILASLASGATGLLINNILSLFMPEALSLIICCILCLVSYIVLTATFNIAGANQLIKIKRPKLIKNIELAKNNA